MAEADGHRPATNIVQRIGGRNSHPDFHLVLANGNPLALSAYARNALTTGMD